MERLTGFRSVLKREWKQLSDSRLAQAQLLWMPLFSILILWAVFTRGVATDIAITVIDQDQTSVSRQLIRMIDATPGLSVNHYAPSLSAEREAILRGQAEAIVLVPRDFARNLKRAETAEVTAWYNAQFLLTGNLVARELQSSVLTFSAQVEGRRRLANGDSKQAVGIHLSPISSRRDSLFNPQLNYIPFLVLGLAIAAIQILAMLTGVRIVGQELRRGTAGIWLERAGGNIIPATLAKLLIPTLAYTLVAFACLVGLHGWLGWPMRGSWTLLLTAAFLLVFAYEALGLLVIGITANYRLSSSAAAFITAPALAFAGQTFPLESMPGFAQFWGNALPLTAFLRLQIEQAMRGAPVADSYPELVILGGVALGSLVLALPLLAWRARSPNCWGKR